MSFFNWYFNLIGDKTEEHVLCPFPHKAGELEYYESNPSAQVNTEEGLFHCKVCDRGYNEATFIQAITGCRLSEAYRLIPAFSNTEDVVAWDAEDTVQHGNLPLAHEFKISSQVQSDLRLVSRTGIDIIFPVFMYGKLLDTRTYVPSNKPKVKSRLGAVNGLIIPFDLWVNEPKDRWTILCAGEKDMAVARTHGFNAITITGGEKMPPIMPQFFKDRYVAICYDNDDAGIEGAKKIANFLRKYTPYIKVVTKFHKDMEHKEDITDYFNKYNKTKEDLIKCMEETEWYEEDYVSDIPQVSLYQASLPQNINKILRASIQVTAVADSVYTMPTEIVATKVRMSDDDKANSMALKEVRVWAVDENNIQDVLHLVDNNFKEKQLRENYLKLARVPYTERNISLKTYGRYTIYKATVTDLFETGSDTNHMPMEYLVYSTQRLESGKKYNATFKLTPHPYQGQQLIMIVWQLEQAIDSVSTFKINDDTKEKLSKFKNYTEEHGVADAIADCVERVKGLLGYNGNNTLIEAMDLAYHTPLEFNMGRFKNIRSYLDTLIVGESRMGKSSTAEVLRNTYGLGTFVSLAGNSATIPGLIGGSNKVGTSYQTKAGLIPQNHKGLMIFEEFGKCKADIMSELTDIRSSNEVRITRVSGMLTLPAMVRMITLSNVKTLSNKEIRSIASYPHGIAVITELVGSAEDIARYDLLLVLGDKGSSISDPYWEPRTPHTEEEYRTRIRWVWSRTPEQIIISEDVGRYIFEKANELNQTYDSHIKIFGTEAWKKLARLAIAVAGYVVSTEDFESIVIKQEHVDYAVNFMTKVYDNPTFKLKQYVEHERKYSTADEQSVELLQEIYTQAPGVVLHLEQEHKTSKAMLGAASGLNNDQINRVVNQLIQGMFVKLASNDIIPTERFRLTTPKLQRNTIIRRVGDISGSS